MRPRPAQLAARMNLALAQISHLRSLCLSVVQYTGIAAKAVSKAVSLAQEQGNIEVTPLHLAAVLFKEGLGLQLVQKAALTGGGGQLSPDDVAIALDKAMKKLPRQDPPPNDIRPNGKFFAVLRKVSRSGRSAAVGLQANSSERFPDAHAHTDFRLICVDCL